MSLIPLTDLSPSQMELILEKLHLHAPANYDGEDMLNLLCCTSAVYHRLLGSYDCSNVLAKFNRAKLIDFQTSDDEILGIFPSCGSTNTLLYPCIV